MFASLQRISLRHVSQHALSFALIMASALMVWKAMTLAVRSESPIVVVLSESMEPAFARGDLLFLYEPDTPVAVGDICVFKIKDKEVPIVHRVTEARTETKTGQQFLLTKGDNNPVDDRGLYNPGQMWIKREDVVGRVRGMIPYIGMITILLNDYPQLKVVLLMSVGIMVLLSKDEQ